MYFNVYDTKAEIDCVRYYNKLLSNSMKINFLGRKWELSKCLEVAKVTQNDIEIENAM
jgi:hypothetical protein